MAIELSSLQATLDSVLSSPSLSSGFQPQQFERLAQQRNVNVKLEEEPQAKALEKEPQAKALEKEPQAKALEKEPQAKALNEEEKKEVEESVENLNQLLDPLSVGLSVRHIESLNRFFVQVINKETSEVIREIPPEKIIEMEQNLLTMKGLLFDKRS